MWVNAISKRRRTEADSIGEVNNIKNLSSSFLATAKFTIPKDADGTFIDIFTEDILPLIFDNIGILTVNDLLNFRLVNRCWRDAATSILLKGNMCDMSLAVCYVKLPSPSYKYVNFRQPRMILSDLCQLISTSPKFPSASICFQHQCELGFGNLDVKSDLNDQDEHRNDLFRFLSLYGKKMRKLSFWSGISRKAVQNLLYVHMPHLTCLDLECFHEFSTSDQVLDRDQKKSGEMQVCLPPPQSTLELREIVVGFISEVQHDKSDFLKELGKVSPNCTRVKNLHPKSIGILHRMGKSHLIEDLHFDPTPAQLSKFQQLLSDAASAKTTSQCNLPSLKLTKLTVGFTHLNKYSNSVEYNDKHDVVLKVLNIMLSANKSSLKHLEFQIGGLDIPINVFIPPLPHLQYLGLSDSWGSYTPRFNFVGDVIGEAVLAGELIADESPYNFKTLALRNQVNQKRNIPVGYFPRLWKVNLRNKESRYDSDKLMGFISVDQLGSPIPRDILFTVTSLELETSYHPQYEVTNMSKIFPNVSHLRSLSGDSLFSQNGVWIQFPKLERFEILVRNDGFKCLDMKLVDSFFTGIHFEYCAVLDRDHSSDLKTCPVHLYKRTMPYIGDCKSLKKIELRFRTKLTSRFVSKVTALHGFKDVMHRIKIIFSFESVTMSADEINETHRYLDPVASYVEVRMKNMK